MSLVAENYIDLKPDSSLLDVNFSGYKLSLDTFPSFDVQLPAKIKQNEPSNAQYGLEHVKLFNETNYLIHDPYFSNNFIDIFYVVLDDNCLYRITFSIKETSFEFKKLLEIYSERDPAENNIGEDSYPITVILVDANFAAIGNGSGQFSLYGSNDEVHTNERNWTHCFESRSFISDGNSFSFIITDGRRLAQNKIGLLLRKVVPKAKDSSKANFWNRIFWLCLSLDKNSWSVSDLRKFTCEGHVGMATLDAQGRFLIIASCGDINFSDNLNDLPFNGDESVAIEKRAQMENAEKKLFIWTQTTEDITVVFNTDGDLKKSDVLMSLSSSSIHLSIKGRVLLGGKLGGRIDSSASSYTIDSNKFELTLYKSDACCVWKELVVGVTNGIYCSDENSFKSALDVLERFSSDMEISDLPSFSTDELEECDINEEDVCKLRWFHVDTFFLKHECNITSNVLFTVALQKEMRSICLRMDIDGILWSFSDDEMKPIYHRATFNAFGYVQASKNQRKFSTCSSDCSYAVIVEAKRHAFVYWQPTIITSDLRNRHTGQRISDVSKQNLITLSKNRNFEENGTISDNIVGIYANDFLYVLTISDLFAIKLKDQFSSDVVLE